MMEDYNINTEAFKTPRPLNLKETACLWRQCHVSFLCIYKIRVMIDSEGVVTLCCSGASCYATPKIDPPCLKGGGLQ